MTSRPHPYFSQINRLGETLAKPAPGKGQSPDLQAEDEIGELWRPFRTASSRR